MLSFLQRMRGRRGKPRRPRLSRAVEHLEQRRLLATDLFISELMASNTRSLEDEDGDYPDWVEVANASPVNVSLQGWHLTDSASRLNRWVFPDVTLVPGQQLVVFASGKDRRQVGSPLHTNFRLDAAGEYLALTRPDLTIASAYSPSFPAQISDISYGTEIATGRLLFYSPATPGAPNGQGYPSVTSAPLGSLSSGTYLGSQQVLVTSDAPAARLHYTTNGTEPTQNDPRYTQPLTIDSSTLLRIRAFEDDRLPSPIATYSFIVLAPELATRDSNLPLVVIDTLGKSIPTDDTATLASAVTSIVDTSATGRASIMGQADFLGRAGLRVRGSSSAAWPKKSYSFETRDASGDDQNVALLGLPADSDWVLFASYLDRTLIQDALVHELSRQMGHYSVRTRPIELYLNVGHGAVDERDYQGVYILMERITRGDDRIDIARLDRNDNTEPEVTGGYVLKIDRGSAIIPATLSRDLEPVEPDASELTPAQRAWIAGYIAEFEAALAGPDFADPDQGYAKYIDVDSWIDYHIMTEFTFNVDEWYLSTYLHKDRGGKLTLGPFWDFDRSLGNTNQIGGDRTSGWYADAITRFFADYHHVPEEAVVEYPWFRRLFSDPSFRQRYVDRWSQLRQTVLSPENLLSQIDAMVSELGEAQVRNFQRWRILNTRIDPSPRRFPTYEEHVADLKRWIVGRLAWIDSQFPVTPVLDPTGGRVAAGTEVTIAVPGPEAFAGSTLVAESGPVRYIVPADDAWGVGWTAVEFDDEAWPAGRNGIGYETVPTSSPNYLDYIGSPVPSGTTTTYLRYRFEITNSGDIDRLTLRMRYDDGFVAYLNGRRIAGAGAPATLRFDSTALANRADADAITFQSFDLTPLMSELRIGTNLLAVQGLNAGSSSPDYLIQASLVAAKRLPRLPLDVPIYYTTDGTDPRSPATSAPLQVLIASGTPAKAFVPTHDIGSTWRDLTFDDASWRSGRTGVGYEKTPTAAISYEPLIGLDVLALLDSIPGGANEYKGVFVRIPFEGTDAPIEQLTLRMKYDDGFVAYLNGVAIARANAPDNPAWDSGATQPRADAEAVIFQEFDVSGFRHVLSTGRNVLAIHGLNAGIVDSDMLLLPELVFQQNATGVAATAKRYSGPVRITTDTSIVARSLVDGQWSAPAHGIYQVIPPRADFNGDGRVDQIDIQLLCAAMSSADLRFDLDQNARIDKQDLMFLVENILGTVAGDTNLDRRFDSKDLLVVWQAGEYEDGIAGNSTWSEGDWNGDGEADSHDIVLAFQTGWYELPPQALAASLTAADRVVGRRRWATASA